MYFVKPYTEKSGIEKYIDISSDEIYDNISDEGTLYMIFTLDDKVVYQIYGNPNNLGFDFDVGEYDKIKNINARREIHMKLGIFLLIVAAIIVGIVCLILKLIKK